MAELSDLTTACIRCGFCLESCPTFVLTGEETESPRGRIYLVRSAEAGTIAWESVREPLDRCLGCRACEPACPSNVHYGQILELARERLERARPARLRRMVLETITKPGRMKLAQRVPLPSWLLAKVSSDPGVAPAAMPKPQAPYAWPEFMTNAERKGEVALLEGCAMRSLFPRVHEATRRLIQRAGYGIAELDLGCCGALHAHGGHLGEGKTMAEQVRRRSEGKTIVVNSAGCGSWLKENGLPAIDLSEFLAANPIADSATGKPIRVTYHDACHLAHGQKVTAPPRDLIKAMPDVELVEMNESDRCCGSAGTYTVFHPDMARKLRDRKVQNIEATEAEVVILGNPGCHAWIADGGPKVLHLAEFLESRYSGVSL